MHKAAVSHCFKENHSSKSLIIGQNQRSSSMRLLRADKGYRKRVIQNMRLGSWIGIRKNGRLGHEVGQWKERSGMQVFV